MGRGGRKAAEVGRASPERSLEEILIYFEYKPLECFEQVRNMT